MDNQQETTVDYIAGLLDGEGCFSITHVKNSKYPQMRGWITFANTDPNLIEIYLQFLKKNDFPYYVRKDINRRHGVNRKVCYEVKISNIEKQIEFIKLVGPHLRGGKKVESEILQKFLETRRERVQEYLSRHDRKGHFVYRKVILTDEEIEYHRQIKELKRVPQRLHVNLLLQEG